jgi:transcriptional regulator with XRE-family HTH domain
LFRDQEGRLPKSLYSETYSRFLALMKRARTTAGLTQVDVANRLGRPQSFVSKCESGERRVDIAEFLAPCKAIEVNPLTIIRQLGRFE